MGKASRWFRALLGFKKPDPITQQQQPSTATRSKEKRRWSFVKSYREKDRHSSPLTSTTNRGDSYGHYSSEFESRDLDNDPNKRAIAVAAATAAVAEAAVVAAKAAAEVVRLTSSGRCHKDSECSDDNHRNAAVYGGGTEIGGCWLEEFAAVKIQAAFRGYLARRALRALRALVRIQALVKGHIARKRTAERLHKMQAVVRVQARARAGRAQMSCSLSSKSSLLYRHPGPTTPEKLEHAIQAKSGKYEPSSLLKGIDSKSNGRSITDADKTRISNNWWEHQVQDEKTGVKILEIDTVKHHSISNRRSLSHSSNYAMYGDQYSNSFTTSKDSTLQTIPSPSSGEVNSSGPSKLFHQVDGEVFCTAENSPLVYSAKSSGIKRSPFRPTRSNGSQSSGVYSDYPNYLSYTESSRAKVRSVSAPKQRTQYERSASAKRFAEQRSCSAKRASSLHAYFATKAYPGSGCLDSFGMPVVPSNF